MGYLPCPEGMVRCPSSLLTPVVAQRSRDNSSWERGRPAKDLALFLSRSARSRRKVLFFSKGGRAIISGTEPPPADPAGSDGSPFAQPLTPRATAKTPTLSAVAFLKKSLLSIVFPPLFDISSIHAVPQEAPPCILREVHGGFRKQPRRRLMKGLYAEIFQRNQKRMNCKGLICI